MGFFSSKPKAGFTIKFMGITKSMSPEEYGHWLLRWSAENAFSDLKTLRSDKFTSSPFALSLRNENGGPAYVTICQLISLNASAYYYYASHILGVEGEIQKRMVVGIDDALNVMTLAGNRIGADEKQTIKAALSKYIKAASADHANNSYGAAYDPDVSEVARVFFEITNHFHSDISLTDVDKFLVGHFVSDIQAIVMQVIKDELKLQFHQ
jgi:hypothetical protein